MAKLENIMDMSKLKHEDVEVNLSSGGVASVAVYDLEAMITSLLTDKRLMNPENIAPGYDLFTGKSVGDVHHLGEIHTGEAWEPARQRFCGDDPHNMPLALGGPAQVFPPIIFFSGGRPTFSEAQKTPKKQTDTEQREALFSPQ